ncbi:hypothetical protein BD309DRAFT_1046369 [Dichomitus squalens]|uniref:Yeast cell wall synthesis Kre9/Knh1-like N-terminal domain-containing protein n=2 Tax=Dichomitus squalens TaxID=114155 RepID=A0A4V2K3G4_9APHY|nr:uncharacterized protein DICSQDRAFT_155945 [Dichomitus squalens LYAD-421 SS1]EJF60202.1 hypothetical protein DICSQDRAFT_155945 [Dichomitus squalens LYAD-421 SS1]TBU31039.1 hypothetical protein BD311DRAFT_164645 [Dichomitus squalens]TBU40493.1 hypothetical protein BD309DRAFT_1046369 [Dichomitus squalens]TBU59999.1 hypothetical protein BD310DRAFT_923654 [Dichomitus squalens]
MVSFKLVALALPIAVANAINILGPSETDFWVQNQTNVITWQFNQGDPSPIDIVVINSNNATLNGAFSIAQFVNISQQTVTVTNVTLRPGDGYLVQFVNTTNHTDVFANSSTFTVKPPGSQPGPTAALSSSAASSSATSPSSASGSGSSSSSSSTQSAGSNGAVSLTSTGGIFGVIAACAVASLSALLL